jgi:predicted ATPase
VGQHLANDADPAGTLLLLDDLQWAGADALELLTTLVRQRAALARVIGAYRSTEVGAQHPLGSKLADLAQACLAAQHLLLPLVGAAGAQLLDGLLAGTDRPPPAARARVLARTGGVQFFLVSCAQALRSG